MKRLLSILLVLSTVTLLGCEQPTDKVDGGGVILSVTDFDGLPLSWPVSLGDLVVEQITINSVVKNLTTATSPLMNVELLNYEVTYSRADTGTLLPPPMVQNIFGVVAVGGSTTYDNLIFTTPDQMFSRPLSDLRLENGGFDKETGELFTRLNIHVRFYGRTLSGDEVISSTWSFTVTFTR